ncbi:MAG: DUF1460 domain-containing protein [Deltaproteobacteria bacterium]|nr:DUF1460 domain-containing protein [Deltaproteobacteria bacterium]
MRNLLFGTLLGAAVAFSGVLSPASAQASVAERIQQISAKYLGTPYVLDPFGEGENGKFDRDPLYRFDAFDCTTYVETMMALALSHDGDFNEFFNTLQRIRYRDGTIGYVTRNHFPEVDWIPNNTRAGFISDVTEAVAGPFGVQQARAVIDKRSWYEHKQLDQLNVPGASREQKELLLSELRAEGVKYQPELSVMPYIGIDQLFPSGEPNAELFARIPPGSVLNVVRPDWDLSGTEGTHLNVSHQALVVKKDGVLTVRHATTGSFQRVVDQPLAEWLHGFIGHPTIKGINLLRIRE